MHREGAAGSYCTSLVGVTLGVTPKKYHTIKEQNLCATITLGCRKGNTRYLTRKASGGFARRGSGVRIPIAPLLSIGSTLWVVRAPGTNVGTNGPLVCLVPLINAPSIAVLAGRCCNRHHSSAPALPHLYQALPSWLSMLRPYGCADTAHTATLPGSPRVLDTGPTGPAGRSQTTPRPDSLHLPQY